MGLRHGPDSYGRQQWGILHNVAVQPLSPATDRRLGGPLPHQLANRPRAHLTAIKSLVTRGCPLVTLCGISTPFGVLFPTARQVTHALLTRPPLRHSIHSTVEAQRFFILSNFCFTPLPFSEQSVSVRLACVRRAASVRPEPGSNS